MDDSQPNIDDLLAKYLTTQADSNEKEKVERWINQNPENLRVYKKLQDYFQKDVKITNNRLKIWNEINYRKEREGNRTLTLIGKAAAIFLLIASTVFWVNHLGTDVADELATIETIRKATQSGQKLLVTLPDGSTVKLNSESEILYPSVFSDSVRSVVLIGEGYFEVKKDSPKPFIVSAKNSTTQVIGTSFNINAYREEPGVHIALLSGKIAVHNDSIDEVYLNPGQIINLTKSHYKIELFNYQKIFGWKEGIIIFEGADFEDIAQKLERWYGVPLIFNGPMPKWSYNGTFSNASLKEVLEVLADSQGFEYELNKNAVYIKL
jgi:transmembrane sensor